MMYLTKEWSFNMGKFIKPRMAIRVVGGLLVLVLTLQAHEGEDHGIKLPAPAKTSRFVATATSEVFEVVIKYEPITPGDSASLDLFLNDFATNQAIAGAGIEVEVQDSLPVAAAVEYSGVPGVYRLKASFPAAKTYNLLLTITAGDELDLLPVNGIEVGKTLLLAEDTHSHSSAWQWIFSISGMILVGFISFYTGKNRGRRVNIS